MIDGEGFDRVDDLPDMEFEMPIAATDKVKLENLCKHEFGHYFVGQELGMRSAAIKIVFSSAEKYKASASGSVTRSLPTLTEVRTYLEDRVCILMAGTIGEYLQCDPVSRAAINRQLWYGYASNAYAKEISSASDKSKADELLRVLVFMDLDGTIPDDGEMQKRMQTRADQLWEKAVGIMEPMAWEFCRVGKKMAARVMHAGVEVKIEAAEIADFFDEAQTEKNLPAHLID